jgi:hypothetical protein
MLLGEATGHDKKLPYTALAEGEINLELCGLPRTIKFKDPPEASLTTIIEYADHIQFVEKASLGERILDGGVSGETFQVSRNYHEIPAFLFAFTHHS